MYTVTEILLHKSALTVSENLTDFPSAETSCTTLIANEGHPCFCYHRGLVEMQRAQVEVTGTLISLQHLKQSFIGVGWMFFFRGGPIVDL